MRDTVARAGLKTSHVDWTPHNGQRKAIQAFKDGHNVLCQAGRRWGKTRVVLHILRQYLESGGKKSALVVPRFVDIRRFRDALWEDGIEHEYKIQDRRLTFESTPNAFVDVYTSESPESARGSGYDVIVMDEFAHWAYPKRNLIALLPTLIDTGGRWLVATTPPYRAEDVEAHEQLGTLHDKPNVKVITGKTSDNHHLSQEDLDAREAEMGIGTRQWRIEWLGEYIPEPPATLFPEAVIQSANDGTYVNLSDLEEIVVAVDPSIQRHGLGDECGIVVAGRIGDMFYVLDDLSGNMSPETWANRAVKAYHAYGAFVLLVEQNQGGAVVSNSIRSVDDSVRIREVTATTGKVDRAMPISGFYERGAVKHARPFQELERQMLHCTPGRKSSVGDDRLDAMVYAIQLLASRRNRKFDVLAINRLHREEDGNLVNVGEALTAGEDGRLRSGAHIF